jgi:uncharacterized protein (TIGR02001 family)
VKRAALWVVVAGIGCSGIAGAQDGSGSPHDFASTVAVTSDYLFRGVSQSQHDPAFQAGVTYFHASGFYAGVWGSTIDFTADGAGYDDGADAEIDTFVGYKWALADDWKLDLQLIRYNYPGTEDGYDFDYNEFLAKLIWKDNYSLLLGYSNDVFNTDEAGTYLALSGSWGLPRDFILTATLGRYDLDDAYSNSYTETALGIKRAFGKFTLAVAYSDTHGGSDIFGNLADDRVVFTASVDF